MKRREFEEKMLEVVGHLDTAVAILDVRAKALRVLGSSDRLAEAVDGVVFMIAKDRHRLAYLTAAKFEEEFDPRTDEHPVPEAVEEDAHVRGVPHRACYAVYLTLDFHPGEQEYSPEDLATAVAGLWGSQTGPGERQDVMVYRCKSKEE